MRAPMVGTALLLILSGGCGSSAADQPGGSVEGTVEATKILSSSAASAALRPGLWEAEVAVEAVDSADIAPQDVEAAKAQLLSEYASHGSCLRPEDVHRPPQQFFSGADEGCGYERLTLANGSIAGALSCQQDFGTHRVDLTGTYTPESYSIRGTNVLESSDRSRRMSFILLTTARRIGDC